MRNIRGIIVLIVAVVSGLVAAQLVSSHLRQPPPMPAAAPQPTEIPTEPSPEPKPTSFAASIPIGKRAVSVLVDNVTGVSGNLQPGDTVDVVVTTNDPEDNSACIARIVLDEVEILEIAGASQESADPYARKSGKWTVTLAVDPLHAAALAATESRGAVSLLARNPEDDQDAAARAASFSPSRGVSTYPRQRSGYNLAKLVPEGMRVFTIESSETDGLGGDIQPGDYVDVLLTCPYSQFTTNAGVEVGSEGKVSATRMATQTLLQCVPVIAARKQSREMVTKNATQDDGEQLPRGEESSLVSLLVTPGQAEKLTVATDASKKGILRLISRNPGDHTRTDTPGVLLLDLLTDRREKGRVQTVRGNVLRERVFYEVGKGRNRSFETGPRSAQEIGIEP